MVKCPCGKEAVFNTRDSTRGKYCKTHAKPGMIDVKNPKCEAGDGCERRPHFNTRGSTRGKYCKTHAKPGMIDVKSPKCEDESGCERRPNFNMRGMTNGKYCSEHKKPGMIDVKNPKCEDESGCIRQPAFNIRGSTKGKYCGEHKKPGMIDVVSPRCEDESGCELNPTFNIRGSRKAKYCSKHKKPEMIDVKHPKCENESGCDLIPTFNIRGSGKAKYCKEHKKPGMVDVMNPKCEDESGCELNPAFNVRGSTKGKYCKTHAKSGMINVVSPKCEDESGCEHQPHFNTPSSTNGRYCKTHAKPGMVDVKNPKCEDPSGCETRPSYGLLFGKKTHCAKHRSTNQTNKPNAKCIHSSSTSTTCPNLPYYTDDGTNYPLRCEEHKLPCDVNIVEQPCISCSFEFLLNNETKMCADCAGFKLMKERHVKEKATNDAITSAGYTIIDGGDKTVEDGCSRYRPDALIDYGHFVVDVETDENQHRSYAPECETARMKQLFQDHGGLPVIFVRFNPDSYKDADGKTVRANKSRYRVLLDLLQSFKNLKPPIEYPLSAYYLFYDGFDGSIKEAPILRYGE